MNKGFSVLEVILAAAVFIIIASGGVIVVIQSFNANRLGQETTIATQFASEGIEAVKSIKNQAYSSLVNTAGTGVIRNGSGVWAFGGANNTFVHNAGDNYIRTIKVESVNRDGVPPLGNIVASGGTVDPDTKKVTSTVAWNFNSVRPESVVLTSYLADWRKPISSIGEALALYGDTATLAAPRFRTYSNSSNVFSSESAAGTGFTDTIVGKSFKVKTSPTKVEAVAGYINNSGDMRILCYDGTSWASEWTVTVGGNGTNSQRFGIAYETNSGDVLVVYSRNVAATDELGYRTKLGTSGCGAANWSAENLLNPARTSGVVHWIDAKGDPRSSANNIAIIWADSNSDLSAMQWGGSSWSIVEPSAALETDLERAAASQDVSSFDLAYESISGNLMVVWSPNGTTCTAGSNCIRYARYTTSWSASAAVPTVADRATNIDISGNPNTNELALAAISNSSSDLSTAHWSGSAWTGRANVDTSAAAVAAGTKIVATGWLVSGATTSYVVVYNDSGATNVGWRVGNGSGATVLQTDFVPVPVFASPQRWYDIQTDPKNPDRLMLSLSDNNSDFFAKRLVMTAVPGFTWSNTEGGSALETGLGQATTGPFGFAYWRNP